jgi:serine phosphatase RsbU (regulator of sigma subunit)
MDSMQLEFSGAFNPLYLIRKKELREVRGDKMPIGVNAIEEKSFTNHILKLQKDDLIYIFSDGYADQFGGPEDKKFRYRPMKDLLLKIHSRSLESQKKELERIFVNWKGDTEQVDDVLIIGVKI